MDTSRTPAQRYDPFEPSAPLLVASDVAATFCDFANITKEDEIDWHLEVAFIVGTHLADRGKAGDWSQIHIQDLARQVVGDDQERDDFFMTLGRMLGWLHLDGWLEISTLRRYVDRLFRVLDSTMPCTAGYLEAIIEHTHDGRALAHRRALLHRRAARPRRRETVSPRRSDG